MHNQVFSVEVVNTYRAWDEFSRRGDRDNDDKRIIDIDVTPRYSSSLVFNDGQQVTSAFEELLEQTPRAGEYEDLIAAKLQASLLHQRLLAGDKVTFKDHVRTAMGVTPEMVDEELIEEYQERMDAILAEHGMRFNRSYENALVIDEDEQQIKKRLLDISQQTRDVSARFTGAGDAPAVEPTIVSEDKGWVGWFGTNDQGEPFVKVNIHPRHKHTIARLAAIVIHEAQGHGAQFSIWRQKIGRGEMDPAMGLVTMHTPESTQAEFNALTIEQLGLRALAAGDTAEAWQFEFQALYHDYSEMVWHNAHIMINSGNAEEKVVEYAAARLPFAKLDDIRKSVPAHRSDHMLRGYMACYEPAMAVGRLLLAQPEEKQKAVLGETFSRPMTLPQIRTLISGTGAKEA